MLEGGAQCQLHRPEFRLERPPIVDRGLPDGLPHLFGARGADRTLRLVGAEAGLIERNSDIVEQPANLGFRISTRRS